MSDEVKQLRLEVEVLQQRVAELELENSELREAASSAAATIHPDLKPTQQAPP